MVYRVHFTSQDLARTRVAEQPMPLLELNHAIRAARDPHRPAWLDTWRRQVRPCFPAEERMALSLIPPVGLSPTFLTLPRAGTPEDLLDKVRATRRKTIQEELAAIAEEQSMPPWAHHLTDDTALFMRLCDGLSRLHTDLLSPYWGQLVDLCTADRSVRMRQMLGGGVDRLLSLANPQWMRWNPPVLEIRMPNGAERDLYLEGQGILLMPSMFGTRSLIDDEAQPQPIVSYPAGLEQPLRRMTVFAPEHLTRGSSAAVSALLGATRSTVLNVVAEHPGCSTKELALLAGVAPASASEHATVLREAGLIQTMRHRNTALHSPTSIGIALLNTTRPPASEEARGSPT